MSKQKVAQVIAERVKDGQVLGLGSGSTVELAILQIGRRIRDEGLRVSGVATSLRTDQVARQEGIVVLSPNFDGAISWAFDGADEVDPALDLIKGRGAAMLNEKIVARKAKGAFVVLVTEEKLVANLGQTCPIPVEFITEAASTVRDDLLALGATQVCLRQGKAKYGPVVTEHGNLIYDVVFPKIVSELESQIKGIVGVVESGLFMGYAAEVLVAGGEGVFSLARDSDGTIRRSHCENRS